VNQRQLTNCKGALEAHNHCSCLSKIVHYVNNACNITQGNRACLINKKVHMDFVVPPPGCGQSVTGFWGWGSLRAQPRTLPRWCEWWYIYIYMSVEYLEPKFCRLPRPWLLWRSSPARVNYHGRTGNRTRDLMAGSQKFWPPSHEAGRFGICKRRESLTRWATFSFAEGLFSNKFRKCFKSCGDIVTLYRMAKKEEQEI
jgi:hypothetical protein